MLPPHRYYYLHNFQHALEWIAERYTDLLAGPEQDFLRHFALLPMQSQALLVRMLMRRGPWFRADKLMYEEIADTTAAAMPLLALGWLDAHQPMNVQELCSLHTKAELLDLFREPLHPSMSKAQMLQTLELLHEAPRTFEQWSPMASRSTWRLMVGELCERLRLMFFGNLHQDWSEFVLADLGIFKYESVALNSASRAFQTRDDVDTYIALHAIRKALDEGANIDELLRATHACNICNPWLQHRQSKVLMRIGQQCERAQDWERAELAYQTCTYPGARHRRIRVYERMGRIAEALELAIAAQSCPESDEESQRVARMLARLHRGLGQPVAPRARAPQPLDEIQMVVTLPATNASVEYALRDHWHSDAAPVFFVENALINSLFGLLCWPAVFAPLPGAFFHPFQSGPADLGAPDFVARRASLFQQCLEQLDDGSYRETILQRYTDKAGVQSPFVFWGALTEPLLKLALDCMAVAHLKILFQRLLQDVRTNRTGFPDLVRFWPSERRYELVEVKAPGDKLQDNQIRWLLHCQAHGIPVRVCHVTWSETETPGPLQ